MKTTRATRITIYLLIFCLLLPCGWPSVSVMPMYEQSYLHLTQWINSAANTNLHSDCWERSPLLKKQIFMSAFTLGLLWSLTFFLLSIAVFFLHTHIFQVFFPPFISKSSLTFLLCLTFFFSSSSWHEIIFIFSNPWSFAKTLTFRSFSNLELNCADNSLRQLEHPVWCLVWFWMGL